MGIFTKKKLDPDTYVKHTEEYREVLYRMAYGYLGSESMALDAVDEAIYLGYKNRESIIEPDFTKTYLTRILIHECLRILKKDKKVYYTDTLPERGMEDNVISLPTKAAISSLQEVQQQVIILRYFAGFTIKETGEILSLPEGTVSSHTRKALELLRIELSDEKGDLSYEKK